MRNFFTVLILNIIFFSACQSTTQNDENEQNSEAAAYNAKGVSFAKNEASHRVEVMINDKAFTTYRYNPGRRKPVLFPILASNEVIVTRGFPLDPQVGEQVDHLHHIGHWFTHGVVNQVDFWATTIESESTEEKTYGSVIHREFVSMEEGEQGKLQYIADWVSDMGDTMLVEETTFVFSEEDNIRAIDRITKLTAHHQKVVFEDSKEGMMAIRVARFMEQAYDEPQLLIGDNGEVMDEKIVDTVGVHGLYYSSEGDQGDDVWGTRAKWVMLNSDQDSTNYSITIMDHHDNVNYPTHWMARGYGLFAANPLGSAAYTDGKEQLNFQLDAGKSTTFTYRILIHHGERLNAEKLNQIYEDFDGTY